MANLTADTLIEATGGKLISENAGVFEGVSIDSRTIAEGEIFFALRGEKFDGHDFLDDALLRGRGAVVDSIPGILAGNKVVIQVKDTLRALQDLAHHMRMRCNIPVVAITGSNGKTTTKEMTYSVLSQKFRVLRNKGNLNNHIGLPLSLIKLEPEDEVIVLEFGMNGPGEIDRLCDISLPSHGIITNIGSAHIGRLGSREAIRSAKLEILNGLSTAVLNGDDKFLMEGVKEFTGKVITFSVNSDSDVMARDVSSDERGNSFRLIFRDGGSVPVRLNVHGLFNVYNALAAAAVSFSLGIPLEEIKRALEGYTAFSMRFEVTTQNGLTVINDSYNSNPSSVKEALKELARMGGMGRRVAVLGDMFELGEFSEVEHRALGRLLIDLGMDAFVAVGDMISLAAEEIRTAAVEKPSVYTFRNSNEAKRNLMNILQRGDAVLVKGSRAMNMEKVMEGIKDAV